MRQARRRMWLEVANVYVHKMKQQKYSKLQLRTVRELVDRKGIERPSNVAAVDETLKKAPEFKKNLGIRRSLGCEEDGGDKG